MTSRRHRLTLCWNCKNAVPCDKPFRGCAWSIFGVPVTGWEAKPTIVRSGKSNELILKSYDVFNCPDFEDDTHEYAKVSTKKKRKVRNGNVVFYG